MFPTRVRKGAGKMATVTRRRKPDQVRAKEHAAFSCTDWVGIFAFGLLAIGAPLAFGGVDRLVQIGLLLVFAAALALRPAQVLQLDRWTRVAVLALAGLVILK